MKMDQCDAAACEMQESVDDREGLGYMVMSPHVSRSSSMLSHDDYVTMASPHKNSQPAYSSSSASLQTSFIRQVFFLTYIGTSRIYDLETMAEILLTEGTANKNVRIDQHVFCFGFLVHLGCQLCNF